MLCYINTPIGLRCPSEYFALTWADVDWENGKLTIRSSKTAHHDDGGIRIVPLFPEVCPYLRALFDEAEPGSLHVINRLRRDPYANLRTHFLRIIGWASLKPWPRLFQNLRAGCEDDLMRIHPAHAVAEWIGHDLKVARKHYLKATEADFATALTSVEKAAQNPAQQAAVTARNRSQRM